MMWSGVLVFVVELSAGGYLAECWWLPQMIRSRIPQTPASLPSRQNHVRLHLALRMQLKLSPHSSTSLGGTYVPHSLSIHATGNA
mmetsp:Transcript_26363/g.66005  ORF Transcript_26363/g.66005 Transcript_26363/m.66005 type:complete len:85 (-) Transcript_26363:301-555(-)